MPTNILEQLFAIWPMSQFEKDFEKIEKIGEGQYGKVFGVKRKELGYLQKDKLRYVTH